MSFVEYRTLTALLSRLSHFPHSHLLQQGMKSIHAIFLFLGDCISFNERTVFC